MSSDKQFLTFTERTYKLSDHKEHLQAVL